MSNLKCISALWNRNAKISKKIRSTDLGSHNFWLEEFARKLIEIVFLQWRHKIVTLTGSPNVKCQLYEFKNIQLKIWIFVYKWCAQIILKRKETNLREKWKTKNDELIWTMQSCVLIVLLSIYVLSSCEMRQGNKSIRSLLDRRSVFVYRC